MLRRYTAAMAYVESLEKGRNSGQIKVSREKKKVQKRNEKVFLEFYVKWGLGADENV